MKAKLFKSFYLFLLVFILSVRVIWAQQSTEKTTKQVTKTSVESSASASVAPSPPKDVLNLSVSPVTIKFEVEPGGSASSSLKVMNNSSEREYLKIELMKFAADKTGSQPILSELSTEDSYQKWLSFSEELFFVDRGEWKTIKVYFNPPKEAALSYYYAVVIKRQVEAEKKDTTLITGAPAVLVLAMVDSPYIRRELQMVNFSSMKKVYEFLPSEFEVEVKNTGNVHLAPVGNIFIDSKNQKDLAILSFNSSNGLVLPDSSRKYTVKWESGFPFFETVKDKDGKEKTKLKWDFSQLDKFRFGRYTAHLLMVYDSGQRDIPSEASLTFWVIPWRIMLVLLVLTILVLVGLVFIIKFLVRKLKKKNEPSDKEPKDIQIEQEKRNEKKELT